MQIFSVFVVSLPGKLLEPSFDNKDSMVSIYGRSLTLGCILNITSLLIADLNCSTNWCRTVFIFNGSSIPQYIKHTKSVCLSLSLSVCLSVSFSVCLSVCLSLSPSLSLSLSLSLCENQSAPWPMTVETAKKATITCAGEEKGEISSQEIFNNSTGNQRGNSMSQTHIFTRTCSQEQVGHTI